MHLPSSAKSKLIVYYLSEHPDSHVEDLADTLDLSFLELYPVLRVLTEDGYIDDTAHGYRVSSASENV